jgi:hypothetical protein
MTDTLIMCGAADGNSRMAHWLYQEHLPNQYVSDHNTVVSLSWWLREPGVLNVERFDCG